jgi:hypothetical protein
VRHSSPESFHVCMCHAICVSVTHNGCSFWVTGTESTVIYRGALRFSKLDLKNKVPVFWFRRTMSLYLHFPLKMEAAWSSERSVSCHITARRHNPEDHKLNPLQVSRELKWAHTQELWLRTNSSCTSRGAANFRSVHYPVQSVYRRHSPNPRGFT